MRRWFLLFVLSIGAGGFFALLVALARTPGVSDLFPPQLFYHWLIGHVDLALIIGFLSFLVALWHRVFDEEGSLFEFVPAVLGAVLIFLSAVLGLGTAVHNNYVPTIDHVLFFVGVASFGVGYLLASLRFLKRSLRGLFSSDILEGLMSVSVLLSVLFVVSLLISFLRTPHTGEVYLFFERLYWLPGHIHQFINATLLVGSWLFLLKTSEGGLSKNLRFLNFLFLPFPLLYFVLQLVVEDTISEGVKTLTTVGYAVGIGVPTLVYSAYVLFSSSKISGFVRGGLVLSVLMYVFGAFMGYMIAGSDLRIPAHYHGVIGSILIALMVLTYRFLEELGYVGRLPKLIRVQPYLYGVGMFLFTSGLFWAGVYGAPRKTFGTGYIESLKVYLFMVLMGVGSVLSVMGGIIFVLFVLYSIIRRHELRVQKETHQAD